MIPEAKEEGPCPEPPHERRRSSHPVGGAFERSIQVNVEKSEVCISSLHHIVRIIPLSLKKSPARRLISPSYCPVTGHHQSLVFNYVSGLGLSRLYRTIQTQGELFVIDPCSVLERG